MAKTDEISSTERLLSLIRGQRKRSAKLKSPEMAAPPFPVKEEKGAGAKVFALKKTITVGVELGFDDLKLVKIRNYSHKKRVLIDSRIIPFEPGLSRESPTFIAFLKSALSNFVGYSKKVHIWSAVSSARVEIRYLQIPKVPKKQIANAVFWTFKKEAPFDEKEMVFDFDVLGETVKDGLPKIEVAAFTAPRKEVKEVQNIFTRAGFQLEGITIIPISFQNLLRTELVREMAENVCSLFIGRDWSRIDIFSGGNLVLSRGIKAGMNSMLEAIREEIEKTMGDNGVEITDDEVLAIETGEAESGLVDAGLIHKLFSGIEDDAFLSETDVASLGLKADDIFLLIQPALERLVRQVERTLGHFSLNFGNRVVEKIYITGGITRQTRIVDYISEQLGLIKEIVDPFQSLLKASEKIQVPEKLIERSAFAPAIGLAVSNNLLTPNFIYTYKEEATQESIRRINRGIIKGSLVLLILCVGTYFWMDYRLIQEKRELATLQAQLEQFAPQVNQNLIMQMAAKLMHHRKQLKTATQKYVGIAVLGELSQLTPVNIRIVSISIDLGKIEPPKPPASGQPPPKPVHRLVLDGIITGEPLNFESDLAGYLVKLKGSPLIVRISIKEKKTEYYREKQVLRFRTELNLI